MANINIVQQQDMEHCNLLTGRGFTRHSTTLDNIVVSRGRLASIQGTGAIRQMAGAIMRINGS